MSGARVEWYPAARALGPGTRAAVEDACALLAEGGDLAASSGAQPRGITRVDADGVDVALKLGRRRGARGALLRLGLAPSRSARAAALGVALHDAGVPTPAIFASRVAAAPPSDVLVMEFVDGVSFDEVVEAGSAGLPLLEMAAAVVHCLHDAGFAHRDLKASNLLLGSDGLLRVIDLDGARRVSRGPSLARRARDLARLAASVEVLGGDAAALVRSYADAAGLSGARRERLTAAVAAAVARKRERNQRRGRPLR
ncbi:MAG: lipopolysaccharide kinase InaA family protein [Planctomycetota bacterium]|nr:lipopolysaccharide kinase InaA family protein [Planctomycetota bacterium]